MGKRNSPHKNEASTGCVKETPQIKNKASTVCVREILQIEKKKKKKKPASDV